MKKRQFALQIFCSVLMSLAFVTGVLAQNNKGTIVGTVRDPNDALVTGAKITATNSATGEIHEATSGDEGTYTIPNLDPGKYRVSADATGFQNVVFEDITLETNARLALDVKFTAITGGTGTVTITAESAPLVESETSVRGDVIDGRQVVDLPIPQRNFTLLAGLSPGVTRPAVVGTLGGGGGFSSRGEGVPGEGTESTRFRESGGSVLSANGQRVTNNNFTLDGIDNNESQFGQIGIFPSPDAIAEFKVETSVPSAESGRAGGAIVSTTFKSGTNAIHGTAYEFYQGRFWSAKPTNNPNPPNRVEHNFGFTVGGPVFLPRPGEGTPPFYDGRNRTFFFFNYNGQRSSTPLNEFGFVTVPTMRIRTGDFSELLEPSVLVTYQTPSGARQAPRGTIFDAAGNPFPGNVIPQTVLNPVAVAYLNAYPLPTESGLENNYRRNRQQRGRQNGWDVKFDHLQSVFGAETGFFGRHSHQKLTRLRDNNFPLGSSPNGNDLASGFGAGEEFGNSRQIALGASSTFTPTIINDMRGGWTRVEIGIFNPGVGGALGFDPNNAANLGTARTNVCGVVCSGTILLGLTGTGPRQPDLEFIGDGGPFFFTSNNFFFGDTLIMVRGNQTLKFGGDIRVRQNVNVDSNASGGSKSNLAYTTGAEVTFPDGHTENLNRNGFFSGRRDVLGGVVGPQDSGNGYANFLLGYSPTEATRGFPGQPFLSSKEISFFVQDDWKVNQDLTLNLGLRYDIFTPQTERFDNQANFDPATRLLVRTTPDAPHGRGGVDTDKNNFGPRIGFAWSGFKEDKTVVLRGGYGVLYSTDVSGQQPLSANFLSGGRYDRQVLLPGVNIATGAPLPVATLPTTDTFAPSPGARVFFNDPNAKTEIFHQYNLTIQYEFWPNWLTEAAYVGTRARNLLVVRNIGSGGGGSREISGIDNLILTEFKGSSWYDALQTKLEKRFSRGLSILASYTWAHAIDNTPGGFCVAGPDVQGQCGPANPLIGLSLDRANSDLDVRHRFTFANVWDLPFGRGRRFGGNMPVGLDYVVGGWQFNNVITIQSGPVYSVFANGARVDLIGDPFSNLPPGRELNRAAFRAAVTPIFANDPSGPKFGSLGRNVFRGQRQEFWDASLFKNIPARFISEAFNVQLRLQFYNVLNHINGLRPNRNLNDTTNFGRDLNTSNARQFEGSIRLIF
jgi:hypothetical protein